MISTAQDRATASTTAATYRLDVYFDYACPYAWGVQQWLDQVQDHYGDALEVTWRMFPLEQINAADPDFRVWDHADPETSSTLRSFQAFAAARRQGPEALRRFNTAMFRKRHEQGRNLGRLPVLAAAAEEAELDLERFLADLPSREALDEMARDWEVARTEHEIFGTPTIVFDNGESAYLKLNLMDMPEDPIAFFDDFVRMVRDRPGVIEIKRPRPFGK